jgi:hypothetical protein
MIHTSLDCNSVHYIKTDDGLIGIAAFASRNFELLELGLLVLKSFMN